MWAVCLGDSIRAMNVFPMLKVFMSELNCNG
jgi:hypothetical protein